MAVNVSKLWGNAKFNRLTKDSKLLYIHLVTSSYLNTVGVCTIEPPLVALQIGLSIDELRVSTRELVDNEYIYVKEYDKLIYFIIPSHFATVSNSEAMIEKMKSDFKSLPPKLVEFLNNIGISIEKKFQTFVEPTAQEVTGYALSQGYFVNGQDFIDYYKRQAELKGLKNVWIDARGKRVRDWKGRLRNVWFKEDRKAILPKDAPKGWEYFYVIVDGNVHYPSSWKNGLPQSKDFLITKELQKEYERRSKNS